MQRGREGGRERRRGEGRMEGWDSKPLGKKHTYALAMRRLDFFQTAPQVRLNRRIRHLTTLPPSLPPSFLPFPFVQEDLADWRAEHSWRTIIFMTSDHMYYSFYVRAEGGAEGREGAEKEWMDACASGRHH
jgi:hypothetical protein